MTSAPTLVPFEPTPKQDEIWRLLADAKTGSLTVIGYGGAAGGGKTRALAELAIDFSIDHPGNRILVGRKHLKHLRSTTMEEFRAICPPELIDQWHGQQEWTALRLPSWPKGVTSRIYWHGLEDWRALGSEQFGHALIEEAGEVSEDAALMLISRLRHPAASKRALIAVSNPWPGWFERWFVSHELPEEVFKEVGGGVHFIQSRIKDNPYLPKNYEALMRAIYPDDWVTRMVDGRFDAFEGQVHRWLGPHLQWVGDMPKVSRYIGGLDFGGANEKAHKTAGVIAGLTIEGPSVARNWLLRFAHFEDAGPHVHADLWTWMRNWEAKLKRRVQWRADKTQMWGISQAQEAGFLIEPSHGGSDSVMGGINLQNRRFEDSASFYTEALTQPPQRSNGQPANGRSWYESMTRYRWDQQPNEDRAVPGVPIKRDDDTANADRYMHEEADGFPSYTGGAIPQRTVSGKPRATKAA